MGSLDPTASDAVESCRDLLATALEAAQAVWGRFDLALERFAPRAVERVARRLARTGVAATAASVREAMARTALPDLALAVACSEGAPGAWEALVERLTPRLAGLARKRGADEAEARTLAADVLSEMSVPAGGGRARRRIDTYEGAGSLFGWAAVILVRRLHRTRTRDAGAVASPEGAREEPAETRRSAPADALADQDTVRRFRSALAAAWGSLSGRERLALSCRYLDGMPQTRIARILRVSEPHTSRIVTAGVARLRAAVAQALGVEAGGIERAWPALAEALRIHLVSRGGGAPLPLEDRSRPRGPR